ncbi:MAG: SH3 domain-containing protein [Clostridia bacterium]|nr:SH3 domain-containing protein [Clostridia bacterium]
MKKRLLSLALAVILLTAFIPTFAVADAGGWTMYVCTENGGSLNVRSSPKTGDNVVGRLEYGEAVWVYSISSSGWASIQWQSYYGEFITCYVMSRHLVNYNPGSRPTKAPSPTAAPSTDSDKIISDMNREFASARKVSPYTVVARPSRASGWVNLRWAPSTSMEVISKCTQGKRLTVLAELRNWYQVQDPDTGLIGFISNQYVSRVY